MCICDWLTSIELLWQENNWTHGGRGRPCPVHPSSEPSHLHKNCHIHTTKLHEFATIVDIASSDGQKFYFINKFLGTKIFVIFGQICFKSICSNIWFIGPRSDHCLALSKTDPLSGWCCWDLMDMTLAVQAFKTWDCWCTLRNSVIFLHWPPPRPP